VAALGACGTVRDTAVPRKLCGTPISAGRLAPLLGDGDAVREWTSASFREPASTAWCVVYVDRKEVLQLYFSSGGGQPDLMALARSGPAFGLFDPRPVHGIGERAVLANDGAIAVAPCRDAGGADSFLLALKMTNSPVTPHRERHVERFMRAYMPATVKSLHCREE
jgi:hypothetical protein